MLYKTIKLNLSNADKNTVLKVGDQRLTLQDIDDKLAAMPPQYKEYYSSPEGKKMLIDNLKKEMLILEMARRDNYEKNQEVIDQLDKVKKQVMVAVFLKDKIDKQSEVKDADIKK